MPEEILSFLDSSRVGVIAVRMPDGTPHASTVHFAYQKDPFTFVFLTNRHYRKVQPMAEGKPVKASFVVGTDEAQMKTLQLDGAAILSDECADAYFAKFPDKKEKYGPLRMSSSSSSRPGGATPIGRRRRARRY